MTHVVQDQNRSGSLLAVVALFCIGILCMGAAAQTLGTPVTFWDMESDYDSTESSLFEDALGSSREVLFADLMSLLRLADTGPIPRVLLDHSLFRPPSPSQSS
jgi:hypothetical protein